MSEVKLQIRAEGTRSTSAAVENINKKLEKMMQVAMKNAAALRAMFSAAGQQANALAKSVSTSNIKGRVNAEKSTTRELAREQAKQLRDAERAQAKLTRLYEQESKKRERAAKKAADAANKGGAGAQLRAGANRFLGSAASAVGYGALGVVGGAAAYATNMLATEGKRAMNIDERLTAVRIAGRRPDQEGVSTQVLSGAVYSASKANGLNPEDVVGALEQIVSKTGDIQFGQQSLDTLAKVSRATGSSMDDLGAVASDLMQKFEMKSPDELSNALAVLAMQAKAGAIEIKDMAESLPEVAAAFARFGGAKGQKGVAQMGALFQLAKQSTGSPDEAKTALSQMVNQLTAKATQLKTKYGVQVFDKNNRGNEVFDLLPQILKATKGDQAKLLDIFDVRGVKAVSSMTTAYNNAKAKGATDEEAANIVRKMLEDTASTMKAKDEIERDAAEKMQTASAKWQAAQAAMTEKLSQVNWQPLIDAIPALTSALTSLAKVVVDLSEFIDSFSGRKDIRHMQNVQKDINKNQSEITDIDRSLSELDNNPMADPNKVAELRNRRAELQGKVKDAVLDKEQTQENINGKQNLRNTANVGLAMQNLPFTLLGQAWDAITGNAKGTAKQLESLNASAKNASDALNRIGKPTTE